MTPAEEAARHWDGRILRLIRDRENHVFEMALPQGRTALRLHRAGYQAPEAIRSELWWCASLAQAGLPLPAALPARDGSMLVTLSDGRHASAIAWIEGEALGEAAKPFNRPLAQVLDLYQALGALLARVHRATDGLTLPPDFTRPRWDRDGLVGENPLWGRFWEHPVATPDQRATLIRARDALRERLAGEIGLIHADVLRENVLVNDRSVSLIDFDDSGFGFRLHDLGTALVQTVQHPEHTQLREALMAGYGTTETEMVEAFILARTLASVGWTIPRLAADDPIHRSHLARATFCATRLLKSL
ncbi:phosphotransferase enzyme family protein [Tabrizicola sp.]|uniref:phosphotransferase enzyme family protein n=1 Tax=Tabrizicola sp. TaxID=2005166 RepID=UPI00273671DF|nr:phosphotransferase [Tabrizicola sp.]MDP3198156.1 phosphotransferase [Tabrizicola sp.]